MVLLDKIKFVRLSKRAVRAQLILSEGTNIKRDDRSNENSDVTTQCDLVFNEKIRFMDSLTLKIFSSDLERRSYIFEIISFVGTFKLCFSVSSFSDRITLLGHILRESNRQNLTALQN